MRKVVAFTDGACSRNPGGPGGWGVVLREEGRDDVLMSGYSPETTNNRMEMQAVIEALDAVDESSAFTVYSDSRYVVDGMTSWLDGWIMRGWRTAAGGQVKNQDLWERLDNLRNHHAVRMVWVRGHDGHVENELADQLATSYRNS